MKGIEFITIWMVRILGVALATSVAIWFVFFMNNVGLGL